MGKRERRAAKQVGAPKAPAKKAPAKATAPAAPPVRTTRKKTVKAE